MGGREVSRPYRVWFFAEGERFLSFWRCHRPRWGGRRWWCGVADSSLSLKSQTKGTVLLVCICQRHTKRTVPLVCDLCGLLEIRHATALTTSAKHWHRQKDVFYIFCFCATHKIHSGFLAVLVISLFFSKFVKTIIHITYNSHAL